MVAVVHDGIQVNEDEEHTVESFGGTSFHEDAEMADLLAVMALETAPLEEDLQQEV